MLNKSSNRWSMRIRYCFASSNEKVRTAGTSAVASCDPCELTAVLCTTLPNAEAGVAGVGATLGTRGRFLFEVGEVGPNLRLFPAEGVVTVLFVTERVVERVVGMLAEDAKYLEVTRSMRWALLRRLNQAAFTVNPPRSVERFLKVAITRKYLGSCQLAQKNNE